LGNIITIKTKNTALKTIKIKTKALNKNFIPDSQSFLIFIFHKINKIVKFLMVQFFFVNEIYL